jgi:uncharacterized protein (DUF1800 family)
MAGSNRDADAASALNRFGLGAKPGAIADLHDPRGALAQEVRTPATKDSAFAGLTRSAGYLEAETRYQQDRRARKREFEAINEAAANPDDPQVQEKLKAAGDGFRKEFGEQLLAEGSARWKLALTAPVGFDERIVAFWSNHFAVSVDKRQSLLYAAPMEREVIRPHAFGRFQDLLLGVETHPAMLRYLDNVASIGPESRFGERATQRYDRAGDDDKPKRKLGLNENLAREILELHTLGVNGGYTQADVTELARAITGWSLRRPQDDRTQERFARRFGGGFNAGNTDESSMTGFVFRANAHEPGSRTILGKRYADGGMEQGRRVLADLAMHPSTANHLAFKLARHFVQDQPPPALVQRMANSYLTRGGDLSALYLTMLDSDEAWSPDARKFRTPRDFVTAALRGLGTDEVPDVRKLVGLLARMGEADFTPRSPAGFADTADAWIGPDAVWKRIQAAEELANRAPKSIDATQLARDVLGPRLHHATAQAIARAESPKQALSVLLASPDFQWRV